MSEKLYLQHSGTPHEGSTPHSGRYPWGSGENPHQHSFDFMTEYNKLKESGEYKNDTEIAKALGYSSGELRAKKQAAKANIDSYNMSKAIKMHEKGYSNVYIAKELGVSEGKVRNTYLKGTISVKDQELYSTIDILKKAVDEKTYIDVGEGVERDLGISKETLRAAYTELKDQGYTVQKIQIPQINSPSGKKTTAMILAPEGTTGRDIYLNMDKISLINEYHSEDGGMSYGHIEKPKSLSSSRIEVNYATLQEDGQYFQPKDGVIELRPGVADIALGKSNYAQVRIAVDDTHYIKGMAVYATDLPDGVDVRINTNKKPGTPLLDMDPSKKQVLKPLKREGTLENGDPDPNTPVDWKNPFGAAIKNGGQTHYTDENGIKQLSVVNKVNEEGDWGEWDKTLASQFLSKQDISLARKQLNVTYMNKLDEFEEIKALTNPVIKKEFLQSFADDCDAAAVDLKAAALPRQATQVLLPLESIKENEIYAPNFRNGEHVCLVRYPHSGPSEIPDLIVNNKNKEAIAIYGKAPKDCVVINPKVANKLSGADFDGDSVVVIPNKYGKTINTAPSLRDPSNPLKTLQDWDDKQAYPYREGIKVMPEQRKGFEMGSVANLITDMMIIGCSDEELARAIKHSMVVVDAPKHKLDWKLSEKENGIKELKKKYQGAEDAGAATLISRSKSQYRVPERKMYTTINPETGEKEYKESGKTWTKTWTLKNGEERSKEVAKVTKTTKMANAKDAFEIASDPSNPYPMEEAYAIYANQMKDLGNKARLELLKIKTEPMSKAAAKTYAAEVQSLNEKLDRSLRNAPHERQAQMAANVELKAMKDANPNMSDSEKKKRGQQSLNNARARLIPGGKRYRVDITDKEWEAIQAGAISNTQLEKIVRNSDLDRLRDLATPRENKTKLTSSKIALAKAMLNSGLYTQQEIADKFGISTTTLMRQVKE